MNLLFCFSLRQLDHIVQAYAEYHNEYSPHRALGNRPPGVAESLLQEDRIDSTAVGRRRLLGGLLSHYYRRAD